MDAAAVIAVERLDHAREAEPLGDRDRPLLVVDHVRTRDRQARRIQEPIRQALVRRDIDPDRRGQRGHRRPDALLVDAVPELDERMAVEPDERDVAADRLVDERLGGRPERLLLGEPDEPLHLRGEVEEVVRIVGCHEVVDQRHRHPARFEADRLLAVFVDAVVLTDRSRRARLAVPDVGPGQVLELERHVLGDVAHPRPVAQPGDEAAATTERTGVVLERRQQGDQRIGEVRDQVGRVLLQDAEVDEEPDDRLASPVIRSAQHARLEDPKRGSRTTPRGVRCAPGRSLGAGLRAGHGVGHGFLLRRLVAPSRPD